MTKVSKKAIWLIVLGVLALGATIFILWGSQGGKNWDAAKWFNYWWGLNAPKVETVDLGQAESRVKPSPDAGLTYDSEESTYAVTKYKTPIFYNVKDFSGNSRQNMVEQSMGICLTTPHTQAYAHGTTMHIELSNSSNELIKSYDYTYTDTAPSYGNGSCGYGFFLSYEDIRKVTDERVINVRAYNVGNNGYADSSVFTTKVGLIDECEYLLSGTTLTIPRFTLGDFIPTYDIYAFNGELNSFGNITNQEVDNRFKLESEVTTTDTAYTVDLAQLPFANEVKDVNYIYFTVPNTANVPATKIDGEMVYTLIFNKSAFKFSISKLAAPTNISFANGTLSWDAVPGAEGYAVFEGDTLCTDTLTEPSYTLDSALSEGEHIFRIRALGNVGRALTSTAMLRATNASNHITQLVALTYDVEGETATKFVPYGKSFGDYLYEVQVPQKEFGGWFYDSGYSDRVNSLDVIDKDMTIYGRLSDKAVTEQELSWWDKYKWYVIWACIGLAVAGVIVGVVVSVKKKNK